jgi:hypothetical protein
MMHHHLPHCNHHLFDMMFKKFRRVLRIPWTTHHPQAIHFQSISHNDDVCVSSEMSKEHPTKKSFINRENHIFKKNRFP